MAELSITRCIDDVAEDAWDALDDKDNPFLKHAFLALLERSGSVGRGTGWEPAYLLLEDEGRLIGAAPSYVRTDSYGEYVFDWAWAQAAQRARVPYYPKITVAVPFTPATGPRLLARADVDAASVQRTLLSGLRDLAKEQRAHGVHLLLCRDDEAARAEAEGYVRRATHQYHFRNPGYADFDAFLAAMRSPSRKQLKKERRKVEALDIRVQRGDALDASEWAEINALYLHTSERKWGRPYLTDAFFTQARELVGKATLVVTCREQGHIVAMSLSFMRGKHLYGRYWGSRIEADSLHFELCYHRLTEYAIAQGMRLVEAGAQGEHKVKRGFVPVITHSAHWLAHPGLHDAVARACTAEAAEITAALPAMTAEAPFREDSFPPYPQVAGLEP